MHNALLNTSLIDQAVEELKNITNALSSESDLSPNNPIVNHHLSHLVQTLSAWSAKKIMNPLLAHAETLDLLTALPNICGAAECEMEKWWAQELLDDSGCIWQAIERFWYINQYQALTTAEVKLVQQIQPDSFVFLGCGALPLTALILAKNAQEQNRKINIDCIDSDPVACSLASHLIKRCKLENNIQVINTSATHFKPSKKDLVICASLLKAKGLYQHLYNCNIQNIIVRDVEGVFRFLYAMAPYPSLKLYSEIAQTQVDSKRINISRLFQIEGF